MTSRFFPCGDTMLYNPRYEDRLHPLAQLLRRAKSVTPDLVAEIVAEACVRLPSLPKTGPAAARFDQVVKSGAWTDAALALIELELPDWKPRRLVCEDGEWLCSLSRQPNLPIELDETAEGTHPILPLAILTAFVEARRLATAAHAGSTPPVPQGRAASDHAVCCDNFV
jgi:hypothetical protein